MGSTGPRTSRCSPSSVQDYSRIQGGDFLEHQPRHAVEARHGGRSPLRPSIHARRRTLMPPRQRCGNTFGPAAASWEFTTLSAPSTTGTGTKACSATPTITIMARTRTAWSRSSPRIPPRRASATSPFAMSGTTLSRFRLWSNSSPLSTRTRWPREEQCTRGTETSIRSLGASTTTVAVRGLRRSAMTPMAFTDGSGFPGQQQFKSLIVNGILSAMGNIPFCQ